MTGPSISWEVAIIGAIGVITGITLLTRTILAIRSAPKSHFAIALFLMIGGLFCLGTSVTFTDGGTLDSLKVLPSQANSAHHP